MRARLRDLNQEHRQHLSLDYGALAGLLFDVGVKKMIAGDQQFATDEDRDKYQQQAQNVIKRSRPRRRKKTSTPRCSITCCELARPWAAT